MRHRVKKLKLNRDRDARKSLERGLISQILMYEKVETTLVKAKYIRPKVEKLITKAKKDDLATRRLLIKRLNNKELVDKLLKNIAPKYKNVNGGYLRIQRTRVRKGDNAQLAEISFVETVQPKIEDNSGKDKKKSNESIKKSDGDKVKVKKNAEKTEKKKIENKDTKSKSSSAKSKSSK